MLAPCFIFLSLCPPHTSTTFPLNRPHGTSKCLHICPPVSQSVSVCWGFVCQREDQHFGNMFLVLWGFGDESSDTTALSGGGVQLLNRNGSSLHCQANTAIVFLYYLPIFKINCIAKRPLTNESLSQISPKPKREQIIAVTVKFIYGNWISDRETKSKSKSMVFTVTSEGLYVMRTDVMFSMSKSGGFTAVC